MDEYVEMIRALELFKEMNIITNTEFLVMMNELKNDIRASLNLV